MQNLANGATRERVDFSQIKTSIPIPNLIEVQKKSYERFLQMDLLPSEREDTGLQSVFNSRLPDLRFPRAEPARVRRLLHRQLGVQVRQPQGTAPPALHLPQSQLRRDHPDRPVPRRRRAVPPLRHLQQEHRHVLQPLRRSGRPAVEVRRGRVRRARHDLRRPAQGHHPADGFRQGPRNRHQDRPRHQGAGGLLRRNSADDRQRHLHHQRHRARDRSASCTVRRACSSSRCRRRATSSARSSLTAEAGSSSSTTTRTCSTSASTASASSTARCSCARWAEDRRARSCRRSTASARSPSRTRSCSGRSPTAWSGLKLSHAIDDQGGETVVPQGRKITESLLQGNPQGQDRAGGGRPRTIWKAPRRRRRGRHVDRRSADRGQPGTDHRPSSASSSKPASRAFEVFFPERDDVGNVVSATLRKDPVKTQNDALLEIYRKLRPGDPPTLDTATQLFQGMFFDPRKYDFSRVGRMKFNIKLYDKADARPPLDKRTLDPEGLHRHHQVPAEAAPRHRRGGRHRPPRQPPRARGGRAARKPVPHRPGAHGARHQGEDVGLPGNVDGHAARPGERQAGDGRHPRVLRLEPALAVHGSDQSAVGDHAQAASVGARTGRSVARARRIRSARRAPHALRPHLPDRDAGRSEHRSDLVALAALRASTSTASSRARTAA